MEADSDRLKAKSDFYRRLKDYRCAKSKLVIRDGNTAEVLTRDAGEPMGPIAADDVIARLVGQIECHLLSGRWDRAHVALNEAEAAERRRDALPDFESVSIEARRGLSLWEMPLRHRTSNYLEAGGAVTAGDVADGWPHAFEDLPGVGSWIIREIGLALIAWGMLDWDKLQGYCSGQKMELRPVDVPALDRIGQPVIDKKDD